MVHEKSNPRFLSAAKTPIRNLIFGSKFADALGEGNVPERYSGTCVDEVPTKNVNASEIRESACGPLTDMFAVGAAINTRRTDS